MRLGSKLKSIDIKERDMQNKLLNTLCTVLTILSMAFITSCGSKKKLPDINTGDNGQITGLDGSSISGIDTGGVGLTFDQGGSDSGNINGLNTVFFDYDSTRLSDRNRQVLSTNAEWLKANPGVTLLIEGHCDQRGSTEYNLALGERRAQTVKNFLISSGVDPNNLTIISYGKERLLEITDSENSFSRNRRANFVPVK